MVCVRFWAAKHKFGALGPPMAIYLEHNIFQCHRVDVYNSH